MLRGFRAFNKGKEMFIHERGKNHRHYCWIRYQLDSLVPLAKVRIKKVKDIWPLCVPLAGIAFT